MKPFPVLACLWILLFLFVNVESHSSKQHQRVEFDSIPEITFRHPSYFVTRMDDKTLPRMKCEGMLFLFCFSSLFFSVRIELFGVSFCGALHKHWKIKWWPRKSGMEMHV